MIQTILKKIINKIILHFISPIKAIKFDLRICYYLYGKFILYYVYNIKFNKEKFVSNFPRSTFFKQSIAFAKSSLPKVLKFHESKKSNKNSFNQSFPFLFLGLLIIVIIIALLTRNRKRQPLPEPNPDESNCLMIICQNLKIFFLF